MLSNVLITVFLGAMGFGLWIWWKISHRGPSVDYPIEHREPGYQAWLDDTPISHPAYGAIARMVLLVFGGIALISGGVGYAIRGSGGDNIEEALPTRVMLEEATPELQPEQTPDLEPEATPEPLPTDPPRQPVARVRTAEPVVVMPSNTPYPTYTLPPTQTPHLIEIMVTEVVTVEVERERVERVVVTSPPQIIEQPVQVIVTSPPQIIQQPPIVVTATSDAIPTVRMTATFAVCQPTPPPAMFMTPTPVGWSPPPCLTWTPTPPATATATAQSTSTPSPMPSSTPLPAETTQEAAP